MNGATNARTPVPATRPYRRPGPGRQHHVRYKLAPAWQSADLEVRQDRGVCGQADQLEDPNPRRQLTATATTVALPRKGTNHREGSGQPDSSPLQEGNQN